MRKHSFSLRTPVAALVAAATALVLACGRKNAAPDAESVAPGRAGISRERGAASPVQEPSVLAKAELATTGFISDSAVSEVVVTPAAQGSTASQSEATPGSMLIRQGTASVQVDSLDAAIARVRQIASRVGGIVANVGMQTGRNEIPSATIELRIPSARFDEAISGLSPMGKLESVDVSVQDVGEEYVDMNARMENARRLERRLVDLLARRTGKLDDVLAVERELARVREEIERYEGRLRYLRTRTAISTLTVTVHEPAPLVADRPGTSPIREAFRQAWRNFVGVIAAIIASTGVLIPLGLVAAVLIFVGRRYLQGMRSAGATSG